MMIYDKDLADKIRPLVLDKAMSREDLQRKLVPVLQEWIAIKDDDEDGQIHMSIWNDTMAILVIEHGLGRKQ